MNSVLYPKIKVVVLENRNRIGKEHQAEASSSSSSSVLLCQKSHIRSEHAAESCKILQKTSGRGRVGNK